MITRISFNNNYYCPKTTFKGHDTTNKDDNKVVSYPNYKEMSHKEKMEHTYTALAAFVAASLLYGGINAYNLNNENQSSIDFMDSVSERYHTPKTDKVTSPVVADMTGDGHADFIIYDEDGKPTVCDVVNSKILEISDCGDEDSI